MQLQSEFVSFPGRYSSTVTRSLRYYSLKMFSFYLTPSTISVYPPFVCTTGWLILTTPSPRITTTSNDNQTFELED